MAEGDGTFLNQPGGLYICPGAEIRNFGCLSITAGNGETAADNADTSTGNVDTAAGNPATAAGNADTAAGNADASAGNRGVSIFVKEAVDFGKVNIDYLRTAGIAALDPVAARKALAEATFGAHCAATGEAVYSKLEPIRFQGGFGTVEFVDGLTTQCERRRIVVAVRSFEAAPRLGKRPVVVVRPSRLHPAPMKQTNRIECCVQASHRHRKTWARDAGRCPVAPCRGRGHLRTARADLTGSSVHLGRSAGG